MSDHECAIPDELLPEGKRVREFWRGWCMCLAKPHSYRKPMIFGPTEIAPRELRIPGPASPLGPCTCECHST